jgi:hypothetical protein
MNGSVVIPAQFSDNALRLLAVPLQKQGNAG